MSELQIALGITIVVLIGLGVVAVFTRRQGRGVSGQMPPEVASMVDDARLDPGERAASLSVEQIEEMVKQQIGDYLAQSQIKLDFGNLPDGGLGIWLNDTRYTRVEDVPDERVREAIHAAVGQFNA